MGEEINKQLAEIERELKSINERVSQSLAQLELLYRAEIEKRDKEQKEWKECQEEHGEAIRKWNQDNDAYRERQSRWDEENAKWNKINVPIALARLAFGVALAALAIAQCAYVLSGR